MNSTGLKILLALLLIMLTLLAYSPVKENGFVDFDDDLYISANPHVLDGLSVKNIKWAFSKPEKGLYWQPLSWLSLMLNVDITGPEPLSIHIVNLLLHILNSLLIFAIFNRASKNLWQSFFIALLFALHPLNVESVAWATERKTLLSGFFGLLAIRTYISYIEKPAIKRYLPVFLFMALSLLAKPMMITLPCILLLLDFWPFGRMNADNRNWITAKRLFIEKIPLFMLSLASFIVTSTSVQKTFGAENFAEISIAVKISNAFVSYLKYIYMIFWPLNLAVFYPFPNSIPFWKPLVSGLVLLFFTIYVLKKTRDQPSLLTGWLWYIGTLIPMIGIFQVGLWPQMADRFTYVPQIGIFMIFSFGGAALLDRLKHGRKLLYVIAIIITSLLIFSTRQQVSYWKNTFTLYDHTLRVVPENKTILINMAYYFEEQGNIDQAIKYDTKIMELEHPHSICKDINIHLNLGDLYDSRGEFPKAMEEYFIALRANQDKPDIYTKIGVLMIRNDRTGYAKGLFERSLDLDSNYAEAHYNIALLFMQTGKPEKAEEAFLTAMDKDPYHWNAAHNLARLYSSQNRTSEANSMMDEARKRKQMSSEK